VRICNSQEYFQGCSEEREREKRKEQEGLRL
jgi:hypothetical protein